MDLSFLMVFSKKKNIDPTDRQNFVDAPGQIPKLILTLCHTVLLLRKATNITHSAQATHIKVGMTY